MVEEQNTPEADASPNKKPDIVLSGKHKAVFILATSALAAVGAWGITKGIDKGVDEIKDHWRSPHSASAEQVPGEHSDAHGNR